MTGRFPRAVEHREAMLSFDPEAWAVANLLPVQLNGADMYEMDVEDMLGTDEATAVIEFLRDKGYRARMSQRTVASYPGVAVVREMLQWSANLTTEEW